MFCEKKHGNGIYKSADGGNTWIHSGLEKTGSLF
jgi:hypothetical protein